MAWIQDDETRMTLLTNHAQGAASFEPGRLEVMLDRRTLYDDFRGIGEGVVDNRPTAFRHWLLLESGAGERAKRHAGPEPFQRVHERRFSPGEASSDYRLPSQTADHLSRTLNYPVNSYLVDTSEVGDIQINKYQTFVHNFPPGVHLMTMRTITDDILELFPSSTCYMVLQRPAYSCDVGARSVKSTTFTAKTRFNGLRIHNLTSVSLTGLKTYKSLSGMGDISLEPIEVKTYKISF